MYPYYENELIPVMLDGDSDFNQWKTDILKKSTEELKRMYDDYLERLAKLRCIFRSNGARIPI